MAKNLSTSLVQFKNQQRSKIKELFRNPWQQMISKFVISILISSELIHFIFNFFDSFSIVECQVFSQFLYCRCISWRYPINMEAPQQLDDRGCKNTINMLNISNNITQIDLEIYWNLDILNQSICFSMQQQIYRRMNKMNFSAIITIISLIAISTYQQCKSEIDDFLQTGFVELNNNAQSDSTCYMIQLKMDASNNPGVAIGTTYFLDSNLDYYVSGKKANNMNAISIHFITSNTWEKTSVSYLVSSRPGVVAGSFVSTTSALLSCNQQTTQIMQVRQAIPFTSKNYYQIEAFVSGIKSRNIPVILQMRKQTFQPQSGIILIELETSVDIIHFNYVLTNDTQFNFVPSNQYPTQLSQEYYSIQGITGKDSIKTVKILSSRLICEGSRCQSKKCITSNACLSLGTSGINGQTCLLCQSNEYFAENRCTCLTGYARVRNFCLECPQGSTSTNERCNCPQGQFWNPSNGQCRSNCQQNEVKSGNQCFCESNYGRVGVGSCQQCPLEVTATNERCNCPQGQLWNSQTNLCECQQNYGRVGGFCQPCPFGMGATNEQCNCPQGQLWNSQIGLCECQQYYGRVGGSCQLCPSGVTATNQQCNCPQGQLWNSQTGLCDCQLNQTKNGNQCTCRSNYGRNDRGSCQLCPSGVTATNEQCNCPQGQFWNSQTGLCQNNCQQNQVGTNCTCQQNYGRVRAGFCLPCPSGVTATNERCNCLQSQFWNLQTGLCECQQNYGRVGGSCQPCPSGVTATNERCNCLQSQFWNLQTGLCECQQNYGRVGESCQLCPSGVTATNERCNCPQGQFWNLQTGLCQTNCQQNQVNLGTECTCQSNYGRVRAGFCLPCPFGVAATNEQCNCPQGQLWNSQTNLCECQQNYGRVGGSCQPCPSGVTATNEQCNCPQGQLWNSQTNLCECQQNYGRVGGSCQLCPSGVTATNEQCNCPQGQLWNSQTNLCECQQNYGRVGESCQPCPSGVTATNERCNCLQSQFWNLQTGLCECQQNYGRVGGSCQLCPSGVTATNEQCNCPQGQLWNSQTNLCECQQNYGRVGGSCQLCPSGVTATNEQCNCPQGQLWNSQTNLCECQQNYGRVGGSCQLCPSGVTATNEQCNCPQGQLWNSQTNLCECQQNYGRVGGSCQLCPSGVTATNEQCNCPQGQLWNSQTNLCECQQNYGRVGESCQPCPSGVTATNERCNCLQSQFWNLQTGLCQTNCQQNQVGTNCTCQQNYGRVRAGFCLPCPSGVTATNERCNCLQSQFWNLQTGLCECQQNYGRVGGSCQPCPSGVTATNERCNCLQSQFWNLQTGLCECQQNYGRVGESCQLCPSGVTATNERCNCPQGQFWNLQTGLCQTNCQQNQVNLGTECTCQSNYGRVRAGFCLPCPFGVAATNEQCNCPQGQLWNSQTNLCECQQNYGRVGGSCQPCPSGVTATNEQCNCPQGQLWNSQTNLCECQQNYGRVGGSCQLCPSGVTATNEQCNCPQGQLWSSQTGLCYLNCPFNQEFNGQQCVCQSGLVFNFQQQRCIPSSQASRFTSCPQNSFFNESSLTCQCYLYDEYLQDGSCQKCPENEGHNGQECVCKSNFHRIDGICRMCDENSQFNGQTCVCDYGYYGDLNKCTRCHENCGMCLGPNNGQCMFCSDIALEFQSGFCNPRSGCLRGSFMSSRNVCQKCPPFCITCQSQNVCNQCMSGFFIFSTNFPQQSNQVIYCEQICGDGKVFGVQCDDGNSQDGDGCSASCLVEQGYFCSGGSSISRSTCVSFTPNRSEIVITGAVHLYEKIVQGLRLTYIPSSLTAEECLRCSQILQVKIVRTILVPSFTVKFVPRSKYQFVIQFQFESIYAIPVFTISVQIHPDFRPYFTDQDMRQILIKQIDPATLSTAFKGVQTLDATDIFSDPNELNIPDSTLRYIFNN